MYSSDIYTIKKVCTCVHACTQVLVHVRSWMHMHVHAHACAYACMRICMHLMPLIIIRNSNSYEIKNHRYDYIKLNAYDIYIAIEIAIAIHANARTRAHAHARPGSIYVCTYAN